jgi:glycosyltransferase involved in cell wall biosynthesis
MKPHILIESTTYSASVRLGVEKPLGELARNGKCEIRFMETSAVRACNLEWADIVVTVRGFEPCSDKIAAAAKKSGRFLVYFLDDDLLNVPADVGSYSYFNDPIFRGSMLRILGLSDVLWGVNDCIGKLYLPYCGGKRWVKSRVPVDATSLLPHPNLQKGEPVRILYAGSPDHQEIVRELVAPAVDQISREYPQKVEFTFIGVDPAIYGRQNVRTYSFIDNYEEYRRFVKKNEFTIGLAPCRKSEFYRCKYYNKFIEYGSLGICGIYSDMEPYTQIVQDRINGLFCSGTSDAWYTAIKNLINDSPLRDNCANRAADLLRNEFSPAVVSSALETAIPEFTGYITEPRPISAFVPRSSLFFFRGRLGYIWRIKGAKGIPLIIFRIARIVFRAFKKGIVVFVQKLFQRHFGK